MERPDARPVTRSRRSILGDIIEKEAINTPPSTPTKKRASISPKSDSNEMETVNVRKLPKDIEEKVCASPARVTRGRRSISINEIPPESPSRNLRKRTVSPESKPTPKKKISPKRDLIEITPKKNPRSAISSLATVDSPKPRKTRHSLSESSEPLRRSRRLSTELNPLQEDPKGESQLDEIIPAIKGRRGKRLSVIPSQPSVPEEMEVDEFYEKMNNSSKSDFISTMSTSKILIGKDDTVDNLNTSKRRTLSPRINESLNKSKTNIENIESDELNKSKRRTLTPRRKNIEDDSTSNEETLNKSTGKYLTPKSPNVSLNNEDYDLNQSKRRTLTPQHKNNDDSTSNEEILNKSARKSLTPKSANVSLNNEDDELNKSKRRTLTPRRKNIEDDSTSNEEILNKSARKSLTPRSANVSLNNEDDDLNQSKRRTLTPRRKNNEDDSTSNEEVLNKSKRNSLTPKSANVSLNNEDDAVNKSKRRTMTPQRNASSIVESDDVEEVFSPNKSKRNSLSQSKTDEADELIDKEEDIVLNKSRRKSSHNASLNQSSGSEKLNSSKKSKRRSVSSQISNLSSQIANVSLSHNDYDDEVDSSTKSNESSDKNEMDIENINNTENMNTSKRNSLTPKRVSFSLNETTNDKSFKNLEENIVFATSKRGTLTPNVSLNKSKENVSGILRSPKFQIEKSSPIKTSVETTSEGNTSSKILNPIDDIDDVLNVSKCKILTPQRVDLSLDKSDHVSIVNEDNVASNDVQHCSVVNNEDPVKPESNENSLEKNVNSSISSDGTLIKLFLEDSPGRNASKSTHKRTTSREIFMNESNEDNGGKLMDAKKLLLQNLSTSTPVTKHSTSKILDKSESELSKSNLEDSLDDEEEDEDVEEEEEKSVSLDNIVDSEAMDAGSDYQSGDSLDESERNEIEDNEIMEKGESLHSNSEEEDDDDDSYEKDSFLCSSEDEEMVLDGTGDDLSSGEELTQSKTSKAKYNKRQEKDQKNASREMYNARHSLDSSKKKYKSIKSPEPESDNSEAANDENEITNIGFNASNNVEQPSKDPLMSLEEDATESSDGEDLKIVTKLYNEELERLTNIDVDDNSDDSDEIVPVKSNRLSKDNLNKSDTAQTSPSKQNAKKRNNSFNQSNDDKTIKSANKSLNDMDRLFKINSSLSKVFNNLLNDVDILKTTVGDSLSNRNSISNSTGDLSSEMTESNAKVVEKTATDESSKKRKLSSSNDDVHVSNKIKRIVDNSGDEIVSEAPTVETKVKSVAKIDKISKSVSNGKVNKKISSKNLLSHMKVVDLDRSEIVSGFRVKPIKSKPANKIVSTSDFRVQSLESDGSSASWMSTAGNFTVSDESSRRKMRQKTASDTNSTTAFRVVSLKKHPKQVTQVDERFASGFANFKQEMMYGKSVKRESSSDYLRKQQKANAYRRN